MGVMREIKAGVVYALAAFLVGFALGALRVLLVAPRVGAAIAVGLEAPVMLVVSWYLARWCTRRFEVPAEVAPRAVMGAVAFVVLMIAEVGIGALLFDQSLGQYCAGFKTVAGGIGLGTQIAFAALPVVQGIRGRH